MDCYKVLARKYRPQRLEQLIGQDILTKTIGNAILNNNIPHAILLNGERGIGKTTTARIIAKVINCTERQVDSTIACEKCDNCIATNIGNHFDVIEIDAASRNGVDDIRAMIESVQYKSNIAKYKVYIIDEVHMLSKAAFNALLKTLEEPPANTVFIFATTEGDKIPETVTSRCIKFNLQRLTIAHIQELLSNVCTQENIPINSKATKLLAQAADGSARDGLSLLEQAKNISPGEEITETTIESMLGLAANDKIIDLFRAIIIGNSKEALTLSQDIGKSSLIPSTILKMLQQIVFVACYKKATDSFPQELNLTIEQQSLINELIKELVIPTLNRLWQVVNQGLQEMKYGCSSLQAVDMVIIRCCYLSDLPDTSTIIEQIIENNDNQSTPHNNKDPDKDKIAVTSEHVPKEKHDEQPVIFTKLVDLIAQSKDMMLKYELENNANVTSFDCQNSCVSIIVKNSLSNNFIPKLHNALLKTTGNKWQIKVAKADSQDIATIREHKTMAVTDLKNQALKTKLVRQAIKLFPNYEITDVQKIVQ